MALGTAAYLDRKKRMISWIFAKANAKGVDGGASDGEVCGRCRVGDAQEFLEVGTSVRVGDRVGVAMDSCAVIPAYVAVLCMYCPASGSAMNSEVGDLTFLCIDLEVNFLEGRD